jgi:hypothetical protein
MNILIWKMRHQTLLGVQNIDKYSHEIFIRNMLITKDRDSAIQVVHFLPETLLPGPGPANN